MLGFRRAVGIIAFSACVSSCYYDVESNLYPGQAGAACNIPATVSYSSDVLPILQAYCYNCHSGAAPGGNVALGTWSADNNIALSGKLVASISWSGASPMPKGGNKLSPCKIELIKKWVESGAANN